MVMPAGIGTIEPELYADKFHLNSRGDEVLHPRFAEALRREIVGANRPFAGEVPVSDAPFKWGRRRMGLQFQGFPLF